MKENEILKHQIAMLEDLCEKHYDFLELLKKHIKVVNGQLIFKGISPKKNKKDYQKILEVLGL